MRIRWIRLESFRGVRASRRVDLPARGVTVVEGPNEIGKSSIAEALDLLLFAPDTTRRKSVLAVRPVGQEVGTVVEAELETGPYRFRYRKRFFRRPETVLQMLSPRPETATGRPAHDRVLAILDETIDLPLFKALRVHQGKAVGQADLSQARSLVQDLDRAAGEETAGERELTIFDLAYGEYERYYTDTGLDRKPLKQARKAVEDADAAVRACAEELRALEQNVERSETLEREIVTYERTVLERTGQAEALERELTDLEKRADAVKRFDMARRSAELNETVARQKHEARRRLVAKAEETRAARERLEAAAGEREPLLRKAEAEARRARERVEDLTARVARAKRLWDLRVRDLDYQHARLDFKLLQERRVRIEEAEARAAKAGASLASNHVTQELLKDLREGRLELVQAQARLDAGTPRIRAKALDAVTLVVDGEEKELKKGQQLDCRVPEKTKLAVGGLLDVTITAGTSTRKLAADRDRAREALAALLDRAGVADPEQAEREAEVRAEAERTLTETRRIVRENLRDLTKETMAAKMERLRVWDSYPADRAARMEGESPPPLAPDYDAAKEATTEVKREYEETARELDEAQTAAEEAGQKERALKDQALETGIGLRHAVEAAQAAAVELAGERSSRGDEGLAIALAEAEKRAREAREAHAAEKRALDDAHPERLRQRANDARHAANAAAKRLRTAQDELRDVAARLELLGERGLFEALEEARTARERAEQACRSIEARAAAAKMLFETLRAQREATRRAYAAPLRDKILELGRPVFGDTFSVELHDDLRIASRTVAGETLPFQSLSVGAREQLGLICRVACALLVDETEGVPLIFDDTLGHTDPGRLFGMGHMLALAGERCQIIVLTCTPERFRHVAGAHVVCLPPESGFSIIRREEETPQTPPPRRAPDAEQIQP